MNSMFSEPVRSNEEVIVYTPEYLRKMSDLVIKTERRFVIGFFLSIYHLATYLSSYLIMFVQNLVCVAENIKNEI